MPHIRPVSDLRNNFAEISRIVHETGEPEAKLSGKRFSQKEVFNELRAKLSGRLKEDEV